MNYLKIKILQHLAKHLLKVVSEDDILRITSEGYMAKGRKLSPEEVSQLREEARGLKESLLWEFMTKELEWVAFTTGRKATNNQDNLACYYIFYAVDTMDRFLKNLSGK